jgi:uncharacterized membrane protein YdjX (TVP38/TMEM64 family)
VQAASVISFFIARRFLSPETMQNAVAGQRSLQGFLMAFERHPWRMLILVRLAFIPTAIKNYGIPCLPVRFWVYFWTSLITIVPYSIMWAQIGSSSRSMASVFNRHGKASPQDTAIFGELLTLYKCFVLVPRTGMKKRLDTCDKHVLSPRALWGTGRFMSQCCFCF